MATKVQKWGNSQGVRLDRQVLQEARIAIGDEVDVTAGDGVIVISPAKHMRGRRDLRGLVSRIPAGYQAEEVDWGKPVGGEAW